MEKMEREGLITSAWTLSILVEVPISWFSSAPPGKYWDNNLDYATTVSSQILPPPQLICHSTVQHCIVKRLTSLLNKSPYTVLNVLHRFLRIESFSESDIKDLPELSR
jgi:hypothetical protein